jgi:hypothetical protein
MAFTYSKLAESTVGATAVASIDFTNIPQNYTDLVLKLSLRSDRAADEAGLGFRINGHTASYTYKILAGNGVSASSINTPYEQTWSGRIQGANAGSNIFSSTDVYLPDYTSSIAKSYAVDSVTEKNDSTGYITMGSILQPNAQAVSSIYLSALGANLVQYSTATLYGVKAEV